MRIIRPFVVVCCALFAVTMAPAQQPSWGADVVRAIAAGQQHGAIPGLSCAIVVGGQVRFEQGFGLADVENDVPATAGTVYRLASISKPITAVLAMQLAEDGQLDLDQDVHTIVVRWPEKRWPVTTRQLLAHLGGVRHYRDGEVESCVHFATQLDALSRFAEDPLLFEPGTRHQYSTYGFNLVAAVVEARAGKPFAELVRERIAAPAGATTLQDDDVRRIIKGRAQGYVRVDGQLQNSELMDSSYKRGGGGLCASAPDLARFAIALLAGKLVKPATFASMVTRQTLRDGKAVDYGLGFGLGEHAGRRVVSHSGAQSRVSTMLYLLPDQGVAVVLLCNLEGVRLHALAEQVADLVVAQENR